MKVLGILGSPHTKGNTVILLDAVLQGAASAGAEIEKVELAGLTMEFCQACGKCYGTGDCLHDDDAERVKDKLAAADGLVLASPNYVNSVTAQLKTLMDRCSLQIHCAMWKGKYGAAVSTAGGSGQEAVAEYLNGFMQVCGMTTVGIATAGAAGVAALANQDAAVAEAERLGRDLVEACREKRVYPEQAALQAEYMARFKQLVMHMAEKAPFQYEYWEKRGWL